MSGLLYLDRVNGRGVDLFREVYRRDLEGIVAKWRFGRPSGRTSDRRLAGCGAGVRRAELRRLPRWLE
jgi:hypothetical protein